MSNKSPGYQNQPSKDYGLKGFGKCEGGYKSFIYNFTAFTVFLIVKDLPPDGPYHTKTRFLFFTTYHTDMH